MVVQGYLHGARAHSQHVELRTRTTVQSVLSTAANGRVTGVVLEDGSTIECGVVIDASGLWAGCLPVIDSEGTIHRNAMSSLPMTPTR